MLTSPVQTQSAAAAAQQLWREIRDAVRESCLLRCEGREADAVLLLQKRLPGLIRDWSRASGLHGDECKRRLQVLIDQAQEQVTTALMCRRLVVAQPMPRSGAERAGFVVRRRVPISDIPDMLDALAESERIAQPNLQARSNLPFTSPRRPALATV